MKLSLKLITHHSKVIIAPVLAFEYSLENGIIRLLAFETCPVLEKAFLSRFNYPTSFEKEVALQLIANPEAHLWVDNNAWLEANMDESIAWYQEHLDFKLLWQNDFPEIKTKIAFLKNSDFEIELFEHYQTQALEDYRKQPLSDMQFQGTKHICFILENGIEEFYKKLVEGGVDIAMSLRLSPPKDAMMCFIRDNTGNLIEIIEIIEILKN